MQNGDAFGPPNQPEGVLVGCVDVQLGQLLGQSRLFLALFPFLRTLSSETASTTEGRTLSFLSVTICPQSFGKFLSISQYIVCFFLTSLAAASISLIFLASVLSSSRA